MGDFDFGQWDSEPTTRYGSARKRQGFQPPMDRSPFQPPAGWQGGQVDQTGGMIMVRRWYTCKGIDVVGQKCGDVEYEVAYGQDKGVSLQRYRWRPASERYGDKGGYEFDGEVETVTPRANTDEAKARAAKRLMQKHSSKAR
jgi:hypothetical protein